MKVVRKFVLDSFSGSRRVRDEILSAVPIGKVLIAGTLWTGSLKPLIDTIAETLGPAINTGFSAGRTLHAEQLAGVIDLGRTWTGSLLSEIRAAATSSSGSDVVDVGETLSEAERLDKLLRSAAPSNAIGDCLHRLRKAADAVGKSRTTDTTNPLKRLTQLTPEQWKSGWNSPENLRANAFWKSQANPPATRAIGDTGPASTGVRDHLAVAARAKDTRTKMEALNAAARAFWAPA